jgi:hypothetical protein
MPLHNFWDNTSSISKTAGINNYTSESTSYNLTGFVRGYEICNGMAIFLFDNTTGSGTYNVSTTMTIKWTDTSNNILNGDSYSFGLSTSIPATYYYVYWAGANIGAEASEIASSTTYDFRASASGTPNISEVVTAVSFSNVPSTSTTASVGYIWVEGNTLSFINADGWKHSIAGTATGTTGKTAGYIWLQSGDNLIHWIGSGGAEYKLPWNIQQFGSIYGGSSTSALYAGTSDAGYLWVDNLFGGTHLAYIGTDGYKYLCGAGANPY